MCPYSTIKQSAAQKSPDSNLQRMQQQMQSLSVTGDGQQPAQPLTLHPNAGAGVSAASEGSSVTPQSPQVNDKFIKVIDQFPNSTLQKFAQRLINADDQPKSPADTPPGMFTGPSTPYTGRLVCTSS